MESRRELRGHLDGAAARRLMHEMEGLLLGIEADHVIVPSEVERFRRWLVSAAPFRLQAPFSDLVLHAEKALADGVLTKEEVDDLLFLTQKLTTVNPYFDAFRTGIQVLHGVLTGIAADGKVTDPELASLGAWVEQWSSLKGLWPYDECETLVVSAIAYPGEAGVAAAALLELAGELPIGGHDSHPAPPIVRGLCEVDPTIRFDGRTFVFTGRSPRSARGGMEDQVLRRRGHVSPNVTREVNYLIICDAGNPHWAFACYGRKVEHAYRLRQGGATLELIHETDFWDAVAG